MNATPEFIDRVVFVQMDFGVALVEVGVGEVEDHGDGREGIVLLASAAVM